MERAIGVALTLAIASSAWAQEEAQEQEWGAPQIDEVCFEQTQTRELAPGYPYRLVGRDLFAPPPQPPEQKGYDPFAGVTLTIASQRAQVTASSRTELRFVVPQGLKPGKARLRLRVVGRGSAEVGVVVGDPPPPPGPEGNGETPPSQVPFHVGELERVESEGRVRFRLEGRAPELLDGMKVGLTLSYGADVIEARVIAVAQGRFRCDFAPLEGVLPVGVYAADALFALNRQPRRLVKRFLRIQGGAKAKLYRRLLRRSYCNVGGSGPGGQLLPADREAQQRELQARARALTQAARGALQGVERAYGSAARSFFRKPGQASYDPEAYRAWLLRTRRAGDEASAQALERERVAVTQRGHLDPQAWEARAEQALSQLAAARAAWREGEARYACPPDPRAARLAEDLVAVALAQLQRRTRELYRRAKQQLPAAVIAPVALREVPAYPKPSVLRASAIERDLLRQVGASD